MFLDLCRLVKVKEIMRGKTFGSGSTTNEHNKTQKLLELCQGFSEKEKSGKDVYQRYNFIF